jgi:3-isopropylmalate/(R)-2-methylmalate dehydratase large subunit
MVHSANGKVGVEAVKPGDTGFARTDLRFSHEYVTPMASIFYEQYVGKDVPVTDASSIMLLPRPSHLPR